MASQTYPRIDPQLPSEMPVLPDPIEAADADPSSVAPPFPNLDIPDSAPLETTSHHASG